MNPADTGITKRTSQNGMEYTAKEVLFSNKNFMLQVQKKLKTDTVTPLLAEK